MKYTNPIIKGFNPDPSICRVGEDYYLATSSFEFFPGIPVYHSKDLVNWTHIGNCIERVEQLPFELSLQGQGNYAPTIRYQDGMFYVTVCFKNYGNYIVSSTNPATGWSDPIKVNIGGIDPSILFDNGKVYYCTNQRSTDGREAISLVEIDIHTGALLSDVKVIWCGMQKKSPQYLEAPHIYHVGDWYYLLAAEGGTAYGHMITAARSRNIWGPYETLENSPLLSNIGKEDTGVACSGHGDLVEDINGNWWVVHLATRPNGIWYSHMGRETFLLPVIWKDELPYIADGASHLEWDAPLWEKQQPIKKWSADFNFIQLQWLFLRKPEMNHYRLQGGRLIIMPSCVKLSDPLGSPTFMAIRQKDICCTVETTFKFFPVQDGDEMGLTAYISNSGYYSFCKKREDSKCYVQVYKNGESSPRFNFEIEEGITHFRLEANKTEYVFSYALSGNEYIEVGTVPVLQSRDAGACFTGTLLGLYIQSDGCSKAQSEVYNFSIE